MRVNTAIAKLIVLNNHLTTLPTTPRAAVEPLVLMTAPVAPHVAEELWSRLGHDALAGPRAVPGRRPRLPRRGHRHLHPAGAGQGPRPRSRSPADVSDDDLRALALADAGVQRALDGRDIRTVIVRAPKLVNVVPA